MSHSYDDSSFHTVNQGVPGSPGTPERSHHPQSPSSFYNHEEYTSTGNNMMRGYGRPTTQVRKRNTEAASYSYMGSTNSNGRSNKNGFDSYAPTPTVVKKL